MKKTRLYKNRLWNKYRGNYRFPLVKWKSFVLITLGYLGVVKLRVNLNIRSQSQAIVETRKSCGQR